MTVYSCPLVFRNTKHGLCWACTGYRPCTKSPQLPTRLNPRAALVLQQLKTPMAHARQAELSYVWIAQDRTSFFVQGEFVRRDSWQHTETTGAAHPHSVIARINGKRLEFDERILWHDPGSPGRKNITPAPPRPEQPTHVWVWSGAEYRKFEFVLRCVQEDLPLGTPTCIFYKNNTAASVIEGSPICRAIETICWQNPCIEQDDVEMRDADSNPCHVVSPPSARTKAERTRWVHSV